MDTKEYILDCQFYFETDPLDQFTKQLISSISWNHGLCFDLKICGYFNGESYFLIDQVDFYDFRDFIDGKAKIKFETNQELLDIYVDFSGNKLSVEKFFNEANKHLILVDTEGNHDTIQIEFKNMKIHF